MLSVGAKQQHGRQYLVVAHLFDDQQVSIENVLEAVPASKLGDHIALAKLQCVPKSGYERHSVLPVTHAI